MTVSAESIPVAATLDRSPKAAHAALLTVSQLARLGLRLVFMLAVARVLGPSRFGVYVLVLAVLEMVAVAGGSGFGDYLTRETAKDERLGWRVAVQLVLLRVAYAVPLASAAVGVLWLLGYPATVLVAAAVMFATLLPRAVSESVQGVLRGVCRLGLFLAIDVTVGTVLVAAGAWLLLRGGGLGFVVGAELAAATAAGLLALALMVALGSPQRMWVSWRGLVRKTLVFNFYPLATSLYDRIDVVLLSKLAGDIATGIYGMAYRVLAGLQLIPYGVLYSILPSVSRDGWGSGEKERLERAMGLLLSVGYVLVLGTVAFAGPAVDLVLGPRYAGSVVALDILIWAVVLRYVNYCLNIGLLATGQERVFVWTSSVCFVVNLLGNLVLIPVFSWQGAAVMTIVTESLLVTQNFYWMKRATGAVPLPSGGARTGTVFLFLFLVALAGRRLFSPVAVGIACLITFFVYIHLTGLTVEFSSVWRTERSQSA